MNLDADNPINIRSFRDSDLPAVQRLYREGLIKGTLSENDTALDIDDIRRAYMISGAHFWVAENASHEIVGMIGVQSHDPGVGEIRRLRVRKDHQRRGIGSRLVSEALRFCDRNGYVKVALDTYMDREPAIKLFEKFHFKHSRTRKVNEKELLFFYLDLYNTDHAHFRKPAGAPGDVSSERSPA